MAGNPKRRAALEAAGMWPPPAGRTAKECLAELRISKEDVERQALRRRAQTDLYWLATEIIGLPLVERVHRPVCDLFGQKDPDKPLYEQACPKRALELDPRNTFKSTLSQVNLLQWILCFPNVRIMVMRGQRPLAVAMVAEIVEWFTNNEKLLELFPECRITKKPSTERFVTPARTVARREPTIAIGTPESKKAGMHPDIVVCDDLVDELNSTTTEQIAKVIRAYHLLTPMLETGGYLIVIGTRYHPADLYGVLLEAAKAAPEDWQVICRSAWTKREGAAESSEREEDYDLLFPERLNWVELQRIRAEFRRTGDERIFDCQYLNVPSLGTRPGMDHQAILRRTLPHDQIMARRHGAPVFQAWDLAYSKRSGADFSVCVTGFFDPRGACHVVDLFRDRLSAYQAASAIVGQAAKWRPARVGIEDSLGVQFLAPQLAQLAGQASLDLPLDWIAVGRARDMKRTRQMTLEAWLTNGQLWFSAALPHSEELRAEFVGESAKDDIPDAVSHLTSYRAAVHVRTVHTAQAEMEAAAAELAAVNAAKLHPGYNDALGWGVPG